MKFILSTLLFFLSCGVHAQSHDCELGEPLQHSFSSGATWQLCAVLNEQHALELSEVYFQAPGYASRKVLRQIHLAQLLMHFHDEARPRPLLSTPGLGEQSLVSLNNRTCNGTIESSIPEMHICSEEQSIGLLAKYSQRRGLIGSQWVLYSVSNYNGLTFKIAYALTEDGRIRPSIEMSGSTGKLTDDARFGVAAVNTSTPEGDTVTRQYHTRASLLHTWRMAFGLGGNAFDDRVEEFNFALLPEFGNRRPMDITELQIETLRQVDREAFRGWLIVDPRGFGYYLDPQNSGIAFQDPYNNWARFDFALTRYKPCETHAGVQINAEDAQRTNCGYTIDDYVNGESLEESTPVFWYSLASEYRPRSEDLPAITSQQTWFELLPFDWTAASPFEVKND